MRTLSGFLFIALMAMTVAFFREKNLHPSPVVAPEQAATAFVQSAARMPARPPAQIARVQKPVDPLANTMASLRLKLQQWRDLQVNDPDNEVDGERLMNEMLALVTDGNVAQVAQALSADEMNTALGTGVLHHWMQVDPQTATGWLAARPETTPQQTLAVADDWLGNRTGLQECLDQLPATEWKENFLNGLGSEMAVNDPQAAIKLADQMSSGGAKTNLLQTVACNWISSNPDAALNWVDGVTDPGLRDQLVASSVKAYALTDPAQAAAWLVAEVKSDAVIQEAAPEIVETWATQNPAAAASWVSQFPEGDTKASSIKIVMQYWQQADPAAAATWFQNLASAPATASP